MRRPEQATDLVVVGCLVGTQPIEVKNLRQNGV